MRRLGRPLLMVMCLAQASGALARPDVEAAAQDVDDVEDLEEAAGLETAARLYRQGNYRNAMAELAAFVGSNPDSPHLPRARFVMAHCLRGLKRYDEAATIYGNLVDSYPVLADDSIFELGRTRELAGDHAGAAEALARVGRESPHHREAQKQLAWAQFRAGAYAALVARLAHAEEDGDARTAEERLVLGLSHLALKDGKAGGDLRAALVNGALTPVAGKALEALAAQTSGDQPVYAAAERRAVAAALPRLLQAETRRMPRVWLDLERRLPPRGRLRPAVHLARGNALLELGQAAPAEQEFLEAARLLHGDDELKGLAWRRAADAARLQNRGGRALAHYCKASAVKGASAADTEAALFGAADVAARIRRYPEARQFLQDLLIRNPLTRSRPRALWSLGWIEYRSGNLAGARQFFRSLVEEGVRGGIGSGESRALYWTGRASERLGDRPGAQEAYARVLEEYPVSYYAGLAEGRLANLLPAQGAAAAPLRAEGPAPEARTATDPLLLRVKELLRLGMNDEARHALEDYSQRVTPRSDEDEPVATALPGTADLEEAVALNTQLGRHKEAFALRQLQVEGALPAASLEVLTPHLLRSHPRKYAPLIEAQAQRQGLSPLLVYALTRTESRFRADAVSQADAHGLMQLIPDTAALMAAQVHAPAPSRAALHQPEVNIRLGTLFLRHLLRRFGGEPAYALAAYNAGPGAAERWQRQRGTGQVDEFVEEIPFDETRLYVKKVLASQRVYERLYGRALAAAPSPGARRPRGAMMAAD